MDIELVAHTQLYVFDREKYIKQIHGFIGAYQELRSTYKDLPKHKPLVPDKLTDEQLIKIHKYFIDLL